MAESRAAHEVKPKLQPDCSVLPDLILVSTLTQNTVTGKYLAYELTLVLGKGLYRPYVIQETHVKKLVAAQRGTFV